MKRIFTHLLIGVVFCGISFAQSGTEISVMTMPPSVVTTSPKAGDLAVNPAVKEIRVTFSKDMMTNNQWSWVMMSKETFPSIAGEIRFLSDKRTCILPVKLEPGKTYVIWINSEQYNYFKDENGRSAVPYLLVFQTK